MLKFKFADIGEGLDSGKVLEVLVKEGATVEEGDDLFLVETEKVTTEIGSPIDGTIAKIYIANGDEIKVGQVVMDIDDGSPQSVDSDSESEDAAQAKPTKTGASVIGSVVESDAELPPRGTGESVAPKVSMTPLAAKIAETDHLDINNLTGGGANGKITVADLPPNDFNSTSDLPSDTVLRTVAKLHDSAEFKPFVNTSIKATPQLRHYALVHKVNLANVKGSGVDNRILLKDIDAYIKQHPAPESTVVAADATLPPTPTPVATPLTQPMPKQAMYLRQKMSAIRKATARHMVLAKKTIPETTLILEAEISQLVNLRNHLKPYAEKQGVKLTYLAFIIKACAVALSTFPILNSTLDEEHDEIVFKNFFNIGVAVDSKHGLMVPVIKEANQKSILKIAAEIIELANKVRSRTITMAEMQNGTFTVSNYGSVGVEFGSPVINYPEVAILGVGVITKKPVVDHNGNIVAGNVLPLSLTIDHRLIDGAEGGRFLMLLKNYLEDPTSLML